MTEAEDENKRAQKAFVGSVREGDIEPYTALRWLGTLFKSAAVFLVVAIVGEFVAGVRLEGIHAMPVLLGEMARTLVLAVVLWGTGDLVRLLITVGNDIRASRILMARLVFRTPNPRGRNKVPVDPITEVPPEVLDPTIGSGNRQAAD